MKLAVAGLICFLLSVPVMLCWEAGRAGATESEASQRIETSSSVSASGDKCDTAKWMRRDGSEWIVVSEFKVETFNHREQGEKKESQTLAFEANGQLRRRVKRD